VGNKEPSKKNWMVDKEFSTAPWLCTLSQVDKFRFSVNEEKTF
jgi:hypothetical protein